MTQNERRRLFQQKYSAIAQELKKKYPKCEAGLPCCTRWTTDIHHRKGTQGAIAGVPLLIYSPLFLFVCRSCHQWIHTHPLESYENHWMIRRNRPMAEDWMDNDKVLLNRKSQI